MIFITALTFLVVGYVLGLMQHNPDLPHQAYKQTKHFIKPERVGAVKRPDAARLERLANPLQAEEEQAMKETLDELL